MKVLQTHESRCHRTKKLRTQHRPSMQYQEAHIQITRNRTQDCTNTILYDKKTSQRHTIRYDTTQYYTILYSTLQYYPILQKCYIIQDKTIQYYTIQDNSVQYYTILYYTIQYNTVQYNTILCNACNNMKHYTTGKKMLYNGIQHCTISYGIKHTL